MRFVVGFLVLILSSVGWADTSFRDWRVAQETDAVLQVPVCRAYTQISSSLPVPIELSLSFPTAFDHVPMMILKLPASSGIDRAVVPLSSKEQEDFLIFEAVTDPTQKDLLWYLPIQMEKMLDIIVGNNNLPLKFTQAGKEVSGRISLSGSSAALRQISRCLKVNEILPTQFFRELNTAAGSATLGPDHSVSQLMKYVDDAFSVYRNNAKSEADLVKLRNSMKALLKQESDAQTALNSAQTNLDRATAAWQDTSGKISAGEQRLTEIPGEIQSLEQQRPALEQTYNEKKAIYQPLQQEAARYESVLDGYRRDISNASSAIRDRESLIENNQARIVELQNEAWRLDRRVDDLDRDIGPLERRKADLEAQLASYNVDFEKQKILNGNRRYQNLLTEQNQVSRDVRQKRGDLQQAQQRLRRAEDALRQCQSHTTEPRCEREQADVAAARSRVTAAESALQTCKSKVEAPRCDNEQSRVQQARQRVQQARQDLRQCEGGGHGHDKPGNPGKPKPDCSSERSAVQQAEQELQSAQESLRQCQSNRPVPRCDSEEAELRNARGDLARKENDLRQCKSKVEVPACDNEKRDVNAARGEVNSIQSDLNRLESRLNNISAEIRRIESDALDQATRVRDDLTRQLRQVAGELADKRNEREQASNRIRDINNFEIPRLQQEVNNAQSQLPGLRRDLSNAQNEYSRVESEYQSWQQRVEFRRVQGEYLDAKRAYDGLVDQISSLQSEQSQLNRNLPVWRKQQSQQAAEVQRLTPIRDSAKAKLEGIQSQLNPLREQEATLVSLMDQLKVQYDELRKLYQTLANELLGP